MGFRAGAVDVPIVLGFTLLGMATVLGGLVAGPARLLISIPFVLFVPGYALLTVLFPGEVTPSWAERTRLVARSTDGISWGERIALSVATSVALLAVIGVALSVAPIPVAAGPLVLSLGILTLCWMGVGWYRRSKLPLEVRFTVPVHGWLSEVYDGIWGTPSRVDAALNVVLAVALVVALASLAFGLAAPQRGEAYTEVALLSSAGGNLVAGNFTTELRPGEPFPATLTVENREGSAQSYTLVVRIERVHFDGSRAVVLENQRLLVDQFEIADGSVRRAETTVRPTLVGRDLRLSYYVYIDQPPETISEETADEHLFVWVDVQPGTVSPSLAGPSGDGSG